MRIFPPEVEERAYNHGRLRDWRAAGLLAEDKVAAAAALAGDPPAHAAWPLRVLLFGFAALMLGALSVLALKDLKGRVDSAAIAWFLAAGAVVAAETAITRLKLRRFGAEEALVTGAAVLLAYGAERAFSSGDRWHFSLPIFSATIALAAAAAYLRYGYRLASFGAAVALGVLAGSLEYGEHNTRLLLALLYASLFAAATLWPGLPQRERARLDIVRFFLALSVPLCLNLRLERLFDNRYPSPATGAFAQLTLAAIFVIPALWLVWGVRSRSRVMLWAGAIGLLIAQCSLKPYLGLARNAWDPALLGIELMIVALALKRRLDSGPGGRRGAFSSESLGDQEPGGALGLIAGAVAASPSAPPAGPGPGPKGGGGGFGGGGASGGF